MTPFERGWLAAEMGKPIKSCPYHRASGESIVWRNGWREFWQVYG
jgi:ribosome modulation factor